MVSVLVNCLSIRRPFITAITSICKFQYLLFRKIYFKLLLKHLCILVKTFNGDIGNKEQDAIFLVVFWLGVLFSSAHLWFAARAGA